MVETADIHIVNTCSREIEDTVTMLKSRKIPYKVEGLDVIVRGLPPDLEGYFKDSIPDFTPDPIKEEEEPKSLLDKVTWKDAVTIGIALGIIKALMKEGHTGNTLMSRAMSRTGMSEEQVSKLIDEQKRKMGR